MKKIITGSMMVALVVSILSFTPAGGEGFEIFLDNKLVLQQFGSSMNEVKSLRFNQQAIKGQLTIKYHHCGRVGKNRVISIKDPNNKLLREWRFADAGAVGGMNCKMKDILTLGKESQQTLKLFYKSSEQPDGRLLTNIIVENQLLASNP